MYSFDKLYIGNQPVRGLTVRYVDYELPFVRYIAQTPFGEVRLNVSRIYLGLYDEALAVAMTAWGELREKFRLFDTAPLRNKMRDDFIARVTFERVF